MGLHLRLLFTALTTCTQRAGRLFSLLHWRASGWLVGMLLMAGAACGQGTLSIRITAPAMNADVGVGAGITLAATVNSPGGAIARVEFFDDDTLVGSVTQAPFTLEYHPAAPKLNFRFTARVTDANGRSATSPPVTCVAAGKVQRQYSAFGYSEPSEGVTKYVSLTMPANLATVRGILVVTNPSGGDTRYLYTECWYGEFMFLHDFAFLGAANFNSHLESYTVFLDALQAIATASKHPELLNVPFVTTGFSSGGGFASTLLVQNPTRVIASVPVSARLNFINVTVTPAMMHTPACIISGEKENFAPVVNPVLQAYRPAGAQFGWMTVQGGVHARYGQEVLAMPLLDTAVQLRYPADGDVRTGPLQLKAFDTDRGWVADNTTWKSGLTSIAPASQFHGTLGASSWLPNEDIAFIYRAYASYNRPLTITSPQPDWSKDRVWDPGANVTIVVDDAKFPGWQKLEFYDGAHKFGEGTAGAPPQCTAMKLTPGYHAFSVLGTDAQGTVRPSNPVLVVVRN